MWKSWQVGNVIGIARFRHGTVLSAAAEGLCGRMPARAMLKGSYR